MLKHRHLQKISKVELAENFLNTIKVINKNFGNKAFRLTRALNAAVFDAIMVGVAKRLLKGPILNNKVFQNKYDILLKSVSFNQAIETGPTAQTNSVKNRIIEASKVFETLE